LTGGISGKNSDLAVVDFTQGAAVLLGDSDGILSFLGEPGLVKNQGSIRIAHVVVDHTAIFSHDFVVGPHSRAYETLHGPDLTVFDGYGYGLYGFTFQIAELSNHVTKEVLPQFGAKEKVRKIFVKAFEFVHEVRYIVLY
jgi:hypothetical protein